MFRNGVPNRLNVIASRKAKDFPFPFDPLTSVVALFSKSISEKLLPNEPKFLNRIFLKLIIYSKGFVVQIFDDTLDIILVCDLR